MKHPVYASVSLLAEEPRITMLKSHSLRKSNNCKQTTQRERESERFGFYFWWHRFTTRTLLHPHPNPLLSWKIMTYTRLVLLHIKKIMTTLLLFSSSICKSLISIMLVWSYDLKKPRNTYFELEILKIVRTSDCFSKCLKSTL